MLLPVLACALAMARPAAADTWRIADVERIVAISDVHGDFAAMQATLKRAGIIDADNAWAAGAAHLVITGDLLDRGPDSRRAMDLVMQLEPQAIESGGRVHLLLGNHEVMNLVGDLRYVSEQEFAAFADEEDPRDRDRWYRRDRERQGVADSAAVRAAWDKRYPIGYFAHRRAFRPDGSYGRWLLKKPLIVVINDTAFVHGGLGPSVASLGLDGVNGRLKDELVDYVEQIALLADVGLLSPGVNFANHQAALDALPLSPNWHADVVTAIDRIRGLAAAAIHAPDSPLWYRGNVACGSLIEQDRLLPALEAVGASRVVIGHTPTFSRQVLSRLEGRIIEIDTGMLNSHYRGSGNALVIEGERLGVIGEDGKTYDEVLPHPRRVGRRPTALSAERLVELLGSGRVERVADLESGETLVAVQGDGHAVSALFIPQTRGNGFAAELAAYRLDRFLGLDMVPVTVERRLNGRLGVLQFLPEDVIDENQRGQAEQGRSAACPLPEQWAAMYVFDALIHNPGRPQERMTYSGGWRLMLTGHGESFGTARTRPAYLKAVPLEIGPRWQERLAALSDDVIEETFGNVLDQRRRRALAKRRDELLREAKN